MSDLVSLIMPVWRPRPDWLGEAVASALEERACELELIVVDDGCEEPVRSLLAHVDDPRLKVIRVEHAGPYAARNAGIAAARGSFMRFVDADDVVEPGSTGRLLALATEGPEVVPYGATLMCDDALAPQRIFTSELEGEVEVPCVLGRFEVFVVSFLFPRAVVERAGPWVETGFSVSGDWDFVLRALEQAPVRRLDEVVTRYRRHGGSITRSATGDAGGEAGRLVLDRYFERHPDQRGTELERRAYVRLHVDRALAHTWADRRLAARHLTQAAGRDPVSACSAAARWAAARVRAVVMRAVRRVLGR